MIMCQTIIHFITSKQLRYLESGCIYYSITMHMILYLLQYLQHNIYYLDIEILKIETFTPWEPVHSLIITCVAWIVSWHNTGVPPCWAGPGPALTICNILAAGDPPDPSDPRPFTAVMQSDPARNTAALTYSLLESFLELAVLAFSPWDQLRG